MSADGWPDEAHGVPILLDPKGNPRLWCQVDAPDLLKLGPGVALWRRMTNDEVQHWIDSKTGATQVRPDPELSGPIP